MDVTLTSDILISFPLGIVAGIFVEMEEIGIPLITFVVFVATLLEVEDDVLRLRLGLAGG
jgi:hypothetical protein